MLVSEKGFDSEGLQRDMSYFVLPSSRECRVSLHRRAVNFFCRGGFDSCKLLRASYGRPK